MKMEDVMKKYDRPLLLKIKDFLLSEIDGDEDIDIIYDFLKSSNEVKLAKYGDILYSDGELEGLFLDGNQYIISGDKENVYIVDTLREKYSSDVITEMSFDLNEFIFLIRNKKEFLKWCVY